MLDGIYLSWVVQIVVIESGFLMIYRQTGNFYIPSSDIQYDWACGDPSSNPVLWSFADLTRPPLSTQWFPVSFPLSCLNKSIKMSIKHNLQKGKTLEGSLHTLPKN